MSKKCICNCSTRVMIKVTNKFAVHLFMHYRYRTWLKHPIYNCSHCSKTLILLTLTSHYRISITLSKYMFYVFVRHFFKHWELAKCSILLKSVCKLLVHFSKCPSILIYRKQKRQQRLRMRPKKTIPFRDFQNSFHFSNQAKCSSG